MNTGAGQVRIVLDGEALQVPFASRLADVLAQTGKRLEGCHVVRNGLGLSPMEARNAVLRDGDKIVISRSHLGAN